MNKIKILKLIIIFILIIAYNNPINENKIFSEDVLPSPNRTDIIKYKIQLNYSNNITYGDIKSIKKNSYNDLPTILGRFINIVYKNKKQKNYLDLTLEYIKNFPFLESYASVIENNIDIKVHSKESIKRFLYRKNTDPETNNGKVLFDIITGNKLYVKNWKSMDLSRNIISILLQYNFITINELLDKINSLIIELKHDKALELAYLLPQNTRNEKIELIKKLSKYISNKEIISKPHIVNNRSNIYNTENIEYLYYLRNRLKYNDLDAVKEIVRLVSKPTLISRLISNSWSLSHITIRSAMLYKDFASAYKILNNTTIPKSQDDIFNYYWLYAYNGIQLKVKSDYIINNLNKAYHLTQNSNSKTQILFWLAQAYKQKINEEKNNILKLKNTKKFKYLKDKNISKEINFKHNQIDIYNQKVIEYLYLSASYGVNFYSYCAFDAITKIHNTQNTKIKSNFKKNKTTWDNYFSTEFTLYDNKTKNIEKKININSTKSGADPIFIVNNNKNITKNQNTDYKLALFSIQLLYEAKNFGESERIMIWLVNQKNISNWKKIIEYFLKNKNYTIVVKISNRLQSSGRGVIPISFLRPYKIPDSRLLPENIYFSIIRQESEFNYAAKSKNNAIGPMQVIAKFSPNNNKLIDDYSNGDIYSGLVYGINYFDELFNRFKTISGALAAYNTGPGRISGLNNRIWINEFENIKNIDDLVNLIEQCPYRETREYIKRNIANYQSYNYFYKENMNSIIKNLYKK
ncbi:transglycosylase SLT domain-containing protein [Lyticum sinuosum]|uniref:Transglycosylase domain protein n=1 Tax=Lyticum sinuosum TaxID=1332059 RepID=A0AAE4VM67_9RICK|nr:transglycosylase SLT domain-containing protein [Lyticum sinuosum]MDZ5761501.1 putative transglycosylase domain protein [Lyticum sinuosum]